MKRGRSMSSRGKIGTSRESICLSRIAEICWRVFVKQVGVTCEFEVVRPGLEAGRGSDKNFIRFTLQNQISVSGNDINARVQREVSTIKRDVQESIFCS